MFNSVKLVPIPLLILAHLGMSGGLKLLERGVPEWFSSAYGPTFLGTFPGVYLTYSFLGAIEVSCAALALASLLRGEFLERNSKTLLKWALLLCLVTFVILGFGRRLVQEHERAANLFAYFAGTCFLLFYVERQESPQAASASGPAAG